MFFSLKIKAQSYHAGDITYRWLYGYTYEIKLTTFTSIGRGGLGDACQETLCDGIMINRSNGPSVLCGGGAHDGVPISPSIKLNEYITTHTYPGPGNYSLCFNNLRRNSGINNIPNSVNNTMSFESSLAISSFGGPNSSPVFVNYPIDFGCLNNGCYTYNAMGTDADGDSLAYKLLPCTGNGPISGYSFPSGGVGGSFRIDSITGLLSWCNPQLAGDYNVGIKIEEWRNDGSGHYFLVGYTIRDTQFTMAVCTGIDDRDSKNTAIEVYPNPATETLSVILPKTIHDKYTIELYDVTGRKIKTLLNNESIKEEIVQLKLDEINSGIYFLKIINAEKTVTKKIIKQ